MIKKKKTIYTIWYPFSTEFRAEVPPLFFYFIKNKFFTHKLPPIPNDQKFQFAS